MRACDISGIPSAVVSFVGKLETFIINPLIAVIFVAAIVIFLWGLIEFLFAYNLDEEKRKNGKRHMLWGIIGIFIMVAIEGIIGLICNTVSP